MAGEKSSNEKRRGSRRRYFRSRSQNSKADGGEKSSKTDGDKQNRNERGAGGGRRGRTGRRRRSRSQKTNPNKVEQAPTDSIVNLEGYVKPSSVFVYTHVVRSGSRDSYEFRAEHFSKVGRRLEDYDIDLSSLYPDEPAEPPRQA